MATQPPQQVAQFGTATPPGGVQPFGLPSARDLRSQSVQRLQVGLFGLAAMLLLVGLANIIMDRARLADAAVGAVTSVSPSASSSVESDPLAEIGVVPSASPSETAGPAPQGTPGN